MCAAAEKAKKSNDLNSKEHKQYRTFIFNFATTLFHELGHVFITFLSLGKKTTPKKFKRELVGEPKESIKPEAGSTLERMVFGGSVVCARNDEYDERQVFLYMHLMEDCKCELRRALVRRASPSH